MLPLNTNIRLAYANGKDDEQNFIQNLSLFLCTFLKEHGQLIEKRLNLRETLMEVRTQYWRKCCIWEYFLRIKHSTFNTITLLPFSGSPFHAAGIRGGRNWDLQNLPWVLEPSRCWAVQRESFFYFHITTTLWQPALWRSTTQTALPSSAFKGVLSNHLQKDINWINSKCNDYEWSVALWRMLCTITWKWWPQRIKYTLRIRD